MTSISTEGDEQHDAETSIKTPVTCNTKDHNNKASIVIPNANIDSTSKAEHSTVVTTSVQSSASKHANPYIKSNVAIEEKDSKSCENVDILEAEKKLDSEIDLGKRVQLDMPQKRMSQNINILHTSSKKSRTQLKKKPVLLLVEGYAFHDDIIGIAHRKNDGEEAFNLTLRNMIFNKELEDKGFSSYVTLRDTSSGNSDMVLTGNDGYPKYLFLSINVHQFANAKEAAKPVLEQCEKLHAVVSNPTHNVFGYPYKPVTDESNRTGPRLLVLSDMIRYSDAFRILKHVYGDSTDRHKLPDNFGTRFPQVIEKYFSNVDNLPTYMLKELGLYESKRA